MSWTVEGPLGSVSVLPLGGMIEATVILPDGRVVSPLFRPAWADLDPALQPPLLRALRGEFLCAPFGYSRPPADLAPAWRGTGEAAPHPPENADWPHGYAANHAWSLTARDESGMRIAIEYPDSDILARLERHIVLLPDGIEVRSWIHVRAPCLVPVSQHVTLALPSAPGAARLRPGRFAMGWTHPATIEPGRSVAAVDARFSSLASVPAASGGTVALDRLPLPGRAEEVLLLTDCDGSFAIDDLAARTRVSVGWDSGKLPHCHVWISNNGRAASPWDGGNVCLGVEPACAAFDLGPEISARDNPLNAAGHATAVRIAPDAPFTVAYRLAVSALPSDADALTGGQQG